MPDQTAITVKKADGATDVTYTGVVPSSGSNSPAIWQSPVGSATAHKPTLRIRSSPNAQNTVRRVEAEFVFPETATASDGKVSIVNRCRIQVTVFRPLEMSDTLIEEAIHQGFNLMASSHVKAQAITSYAAT